MQRGPKRFAA